MITIRDLIDRPAWMDDANCKGLDVQLFYPVSSAEADKPKVDAVCRACDVQAECLAYALNTNEDHGTWGGLSERKRRSLRRNHRNQLIADGDAGLRGPLRAARSTPS